MENSELEKEKNMEQGVDYKKLYLGQKIRTLETEMNAIQMRFEMIQTELPQARKEWVDYMEEVKQENEKPEPGKIQSVKPKDTKKD